MHTMLFMNYKEFFQSIYDYSVSARSLTRIKDIDLYRHFQHIPCITSLALIVLSTLLLVLCYKHKLHILSFIYTLCNGCYGLLCHRPKDKLFDCFISYTRADRDVAFEILEELEKKPPGFNFCIHERNWTPGEYIPSNIFFSVQNSRNTLIILSETFLKSRWFHLEFQAAFQQMLQDKKHRIILILKDLADRSKLPKDVQFFIFTRSCLTWGDRWFWEKLKYSLEDDDDFAKRKKQSGFREMASYLYERNESYRKTFEMDVV